LNEITFRQAGSLEKSLKESGLLLPVYVGFRHSRPFLRETLDRMTADGIKRALGLILSPYQAEASWERYKKNVEAAQQELGGCGPEIDYCPCWHDHPLLIQAWAERIQCALDKVAVQKRQATRLIFTAHSVPVAMAAQSHYAEQVHETSRLIAERLSHHRWFVAYQSRSGKPSEPWLEPDIGEVLRTLASEGTTEVVVAPIGFVCDHVEVLYDLDIEARRIAESLGIRFSRASSLNDHPTFIRMMADVIAKKLSAVSSQQKSLKPQS
jgi:ferrochelatase